MTLLRKFDFQYVALGSDRVDLRGAPNCDLWDLKASMADGQEDVSDLIDDHICMQLISIDFNVCYFNKSSTAHVQQRLRPQSTPHQRPH